MLKLCCPVVFLMLAAAGCGKEEQTYHPTLGDQPMGMAKEYIFGVHPLHNPNRLLELYGPVVDELNRNVHGAHFKLEASRNYEEFEKKLYAGHFDFALPNPYQTLNSLQHGYRIFGKMGDDDNFRGIILVRRDSGIKLVADLKGKAVSYPAATALAATMMPQYFLHVNGLDVNRDIENLYVGSQESSIMNVYLGKVAAGATWPIPWLTFQKEHPDIAATLEVRWQTGTLPNNGLVARQDMPPQLVREVGKELFALQLSEPGRTMLAKLPISRFEPADAATYAPVEIFLQRFTAEIRPLDR